MEHKVSLSLKNFVFLRAFLVELCGITKLHILIISHYIGYTNDYRLNSKAATP